MHDSSNKKALIEKHTVAKVLEEGTKNYPFRPEATRSDQKKLPRNYPETT